MQGALEGIKVIDLTTLLPGPLATLMLAEAGADVLKVERPGGEDMRRYPPFVEGQSVTFALLNRRKRFLELDLKSGAGLAEIRRLVAEADILVEQFRPGVMERLGLGYDRLAEINPALIMCSISGYGQNGPRAGEAGHDINYMGLTGVLELSRGPVEAPVLPPTQIADIGGGSFPAVINVLMALIARNRTGVGCHLDIAMTDAMFAFAPFAHADLFGKGGLDPTGTMLLTGGTPRYGLYPTRDDRLVAVGALEDKFWQALCQVLDLAEQFRDDRRDPSATSTEMVRIFRTRDAAEWAPLLLKADCCATIVCDLRDAFADDHFRQRGLFDHKLDFGAGETIPALPLPLSPHLRKPVD